ncbi:DUF4158 domain-containing protein [Nocardia cyriacigeorgica]|uniref:DUF4158 domain-containing protein n=1 Tax=Nocardia cyriacigeorgica TaxID=135487 RepID=UPI002B4B2A5C|nr:DUF4158 domain-containing protein [Nocardia cyriacigeorgica]
MRQEWSTEDLIGTWTLVGNDWQLVGNKSGGTRLGFSVLLELFELEARFPAGTEELPASAVAYMADQVKVDPALLSAYRWTGRTIEYHRGQIRDASGFRESSRSDEDKPVPWLTVLAVSGVPDRHAVDDAAATVSTTPADALQAIGSYQAENGSLTLMTLLLLTISALVIGAFFTVWTIQRLSDIATLKALGATSAALVRDALAQAAIVLMAGVAAGLGITMASASLMGDGVPFVIAPATTLLPAGALVLLGLGGAAFALRFLFTTDPLTALGAAR